MTPAMERTLNFLAKTPTPKKTKTAEDLREKHSQNSSKDSSKTPACQEDRRQHSRNNKVPIPEVHDRLQSKPDGGEERGAVNVKEAKMKLEDRISKERREMQVDMIRKPLLATPNQKRSRADDGEWDTIPPSPRNIVTPTTSRKIQTPINVFLINQTLEERRQELLKNSANRPTKAKDISASPALKKCKKKKLQATRKTKDGDRSLQQKPNIVSTIAGSLRRARSTQLCLALYPEC